MSHESSRPSPGLGARRPSASVQALLLVPYLQLLTRAQAKRLRAGVPLLTSDPYYVRLTRVRCLGRQIRVLDYGGGIFYLIYVYVPYVL